MNPKNHIPTNAKLVFKWKIFDVYQWEQIMFDWTTKIFEKLKRNDTIDVLAITQDKKILILEEKQPWRKPFLWLIWWTCENWETPLQTAKRELLEETWYISNEWKLFKKSQISSKIIYNSNIFIAKNCKKIQKQNLDEGWEIIKVKKVSWTKFLEIIINPKFKVKELTLEILKMIYLWKENKIKEILFQNK